MRNKVYGTLESQKKKKKKKTKKGWLLDCIIMPTNMHANERRPSKKWLNIHVLQQGHICSLR